MNPASKAAVPALAQALSSGNPLVRMNAARALFRLGTEARPAIPELIQALQDKRNRTYLQVFPLTIQDQVALALGRASAGVNDGVPVLLAGLKAAGAEPARISFARALGIIGAEARPAFPALRAMLQAARPVSL